MTIRLYFTGSGNGQASEGDLQAMQQLASELAVQGSTQVDPTGLDAARQIALEYYAHLGAGEYAEAAALYGGDLQELVYFNPDLENAGAPALFEAACTVNGFICLPVKNIVSTDQLSKDVFRVVVEWQNPDGSLFELGPCCGGDDLPLAQFDVLVHSIDGEYKVMQLPQYVP